MANKREYCDECGVPVDGSGPDTGPHAYFGGHPGCYGLFNEVIAREFSDAAYFSVHRLTVDTYAVQHPGSDKDRRAVQSVNIHLMALYLAIEARAANPQIVHTLKKAASKGKTIFEPLSRPEPAAYMMTVGDVLKADNAQQHCKFVREWAEATWQAWQEHHSLAKAYAEKFGG
jgi:Family of unknown function (DUF5946)